VFQPPPLSSGLAADGVRLVFSDPAVPASFGTFFFDDLDCLIFVTR